MVTPAMGRPRIKASSDVTLTLRAPASVRDLIDRAAQAVGKNRTEFMLESASTRAEEVLLEQRTFTLGDDLFQEFSRLLDNPPAPNEALRKLMSTKSAWEK